MRNVLISAALAILKRLMDRRIIEALGKLVITAASAPIPGVEKRAMVLGQLYDVYQELQPALEAAGKALVSAALELLVAQMQARMK